MYKEKFYTFLDLNESWTKGHADEKDNGSI